MKVKASLMAIIMFVGAQACNASITPEQHLELERYSESISAAPTVQQEEEAVRNFANYLRVSGMKITPDYDSNVETNQPLTVDWEGPGVFDSSLKPGEVGSVWISRSSFKLKKAGHLSLLNDVILPPVDRREKELNNARAEKVFLDEQQEVERLHAAMLASNDQLRRKIVGCIVIAVVALIIGVPAWVRYRRRLRTRRDLQ